MSPATHFGRTPSEYAHGVRLLVTGTRELLDDVLADIGTARGGLADRVETVSALLAVLEEKALALTALCEEAEVRANAEARRRPAVPRTPAAGSP